MLMYCCVSYHKFGDPRYLQHSKSAIEALLAQKESRFYEALLPLGVYTAAYLNAMKGANYDVAKLLDWVFDGCKACRRTVGNYVGNGVIMM